MLKLISVNIQQDKHHNTVLNFLEKEKPDVVCLQEVFKKDLSTYENALGMKSFFKPMCYFLSSAGEYELLGIAILTKQMTNFNYQYIVGDEKDIPKFIHSKDPLKERNTINILIMWGDIEYNSQYYRISNTHFTWTQGGLSLPFQKEDAKILVNVLEDEVREFVLVGDLNAPRGFGTFEMLSGKYKDNIPLEYDSSIDPKLHKVPGLLRMVDGLFSTPQYSVSNVEFMEGVSDHKALVANIEKINEK